ncbi:hypothetical protein CGRA01v4_14726 [Colletotrichum graminicola]|nr:hypothetical protein CGRA01v4_14726 [Colletotrichum graminicola]
MLRRTRTNTPSSRVFVLFFPSLGKYLPNEAFIDLFLHVERDSESSPWACAPYEASITRHSASPRHNLIDVSNLVVRGQNAEGIGIETEVGEILTFVLSTVPYSTWNPPPPLRALRLNAHAHNIAALTSGRISSNSPCLTFFNHRNEFPMLTCPAAITSVGILISQPSHHSRRAPPLSLSVHGPPLVHVSATLAQTSLLSAPRSQRSD